MGCGPQGHPVAAITQRSMPSLLRFESERTNECLRAAHRKHHRSPGPPSLTRHLSRRCRVTNMQLERLLACIKRAGGSVKPYSLERFLADGYLNQFISQHLRNGGSDPRVMTRSSLVGDGVPLAAEVHRRKNVVESRGGAPAWMMYAAERAAERKSAAEYDGKAGYQLWRKRMAEELHIEGNNYHVACAERRSTTWVGDGVSKVYIA